MARGRRRTSNRWLAICFPDQLDHVAGGIADVEGRRVLLRAFLLDRDALAREPLAHRDIVPSAGRYGEMVEVATWSRAFERPGAVRIRGVDQSHPRREFEHAPLRDAVLHRAAEHAAIEMLGRIHPAQATT